MPSSNFDQAQFIFGVSVGFCFDANSKVMVLFSLFSSESFIVLTLTFRSFIYLEFFFGEINV